MMEEQEDKQRKLERCFKGWVITVIDGMQSDSE